jgi:hypothetical protein
MVNEDLDLKTMAPGLVGLYAFCQAINKVGNQSPYPVPTLDIVSTEKVPEFKSNPVHFSFSKNSFKVYINPKLERVSMEDGGGHDLMHALTTNIAKKFARERAGADINNSSFKRSESGMTSKANLYRTNPKIFQGIAKDLAKYGIDYLSLKDSKAVQHAANILYGKKDLVNNSNRVGREGWKEEYDEIGNLISALTIGSRRTHFSPSLKMSSDAQLKNISKKKYGEEYGMSDSSDASNFDLPQYGAEENFGNYIGEAIAPSIDHSSPISAEKVLKHLRTRIEERSDDEDLSLYLEDFLYAKFEKFLTTVFETYNTLLGKYGSVVSKNRQ